ncbi:hypothetical protein PM082_007310 [Marasmius tenuissimus]|nr:hypothetical protein PM082_007310 [Marasmius tenuissimus]
MHHRLMGLVMSKDALKLILHCNIQGESGLDQVNSHEFNDMISQFNLPTQSPVPEPIEPATDDYARKRTMFIQPPLTSDRFKTIIEDTNIGVTEDSRFHNELGCRYKSVRKDWGKRTSRISVEDNSTQEILSEEVINAKPQENTSSSSSSATQAPPSPTGPAILDNVKRTTNTTGIDIHINSSLQTACKRAKRWKIAHSYMIDSSDKDEGGMLTATSDSEEANNLTSNQAADWDDAMGGGRDHWEEDDWEQEGAH